MVFEIDKDAEFFLAKLDDSDFQFLYGSYFVYKNYITEGT
jgi:hypothetical protein